MIMKKKCRISAVRSAVTVEEAPSSIPADAPGEGKVWDLTVYRGVCRVMGMKMERREDQE